MSFCVFVTVEEGGSAAAKTAAKCLRKLSHALCPLVFQVIYKERSSYIRIVPVPKVSSH